MSHQEKVEDKLKFLNLPEYFGFLSTCRIRHGNSCGCILCMGSWGGCTCFFLFFFIGRSFYRPGCTCFFNFLSANLLIRQGAPVLYQLFFFLARVHLLLPPLLTSTAEPPPPASPSTPLFGLFLSVSFPPPPTCPFKQLKRRLITRIVFSIALSETEKYTAHVLCILCKRFDLDI